MTNAVHSGLEDVVAAETRLSSVDGENGELIIAGFPLDELATNATYEETVSLLWNDELPDADELNSVRETLAAQRSLPDATLNLLREAAEADVPVMDALRMGAATLSIDLPDDDPTTGARAVVARFPTVVAAYWRLLQGEDPVEPRSDLGHAANYLYMLSGEVPSDERVRGLETYLNTVVDHGLNASTFTARAIISTESDIVSAVTGAVGALKGPLHGGAPGPVLDMLIDIRESGDVDAALREKLDAGERIMGFGHRVYKVHDPRADVLSAAAERFYEAQEDEGLYELAREVESTAVDLLAEYKPDRKLETNVEFYTALLLHGLDLPTDLFSPTFAISRVGGWTAHCLEQLEANRLIRPQSSYAGETGRTWVPVDER